MRIIKIQRCLLTITLAVLLTAAFVLEGCTNAQTEGEKDAVTSPTIKPAEVSEETIIPVLRPYDAPTGVPEPIISQMPLQTLKATEGPSETPADNVSVPPNSAVPTEEPTPTPLVMTEMEYVAGYVNETYVNLREEPSTDADILKVCAMGTELYVTGRSDEWFRVVVDDIVGYMARDYVKLGYFETPTPEPTPTSKPTPKPKPTATPQPTPAAMYTVHEGQFSDEDIKLVAALIHCEGPGSTKVGYRAIASIVLNRVFNSSGRFPNDVPGVLFQSGQFGYSRSYLESVNPNSKAMAAAIYVFSTHGATLPKKVLFYRASYLGKPWTDYTKYYATIEVNNYYYGLYYF